ncbi:hypothetical protein ACQY0O_006612 [Thecaphora frezii]
MDSQHLVSPQEAVAQAQARRMQPSDAMSHHSHHGHGSEDVSGGQQYFNPAAMHSRNMSMEGAGGHYGGMQLPPLGANAGGHGNGGYLSHPGLNHQSPRLMNQSPQQHSSPAPTLFGSSPGHPYGSHFQAQSHAMPSQLSHPQHSPNNAHAHVHGGHNAGSMQMYGYGASPQQHYSHVPGQAAHGGMGGMVSGAGSNPMMGAPGSGNSEQFGNFGQQQQQQQQHYQQYFHPGGVQSIAPGQAGSVPTNAAASNAAAAPAPAPAPAVPAPAPAAPAATKAKSEPKRAKAPAGSSRSKKGVSPNDEKPSKERHHPYASDEKEAKPSASKKGKKDDPPKPPVLKSHLKPPKQAPSAWQIFFTEELQKIKAQSPGEKLNVAHVAKDAGQRYAALPDKAKEEFQRRSLEAKELWEKEMAEWKSKLTPEDIRQENMYRTAQRKAGKSRKGNLKDPNAPKKPLSAYFLFLRAIRADPNMTQEVFEGEQETTKQSVLAAAKWRSLSETEKQPYLDKAEQDKARYEHLRQEYEQLHGIEPSSSKAGAKAEEEEEDDDDDGDDL